MKMETKKTVYSSSEEDFNLSKVIFLPKAFTGAVTGASLLSF